MKVEIVLTEADIAQEFAEAMEARDLPGKFFYWFPRLGGGVVWRSRKEDRALRRPQRNLEGDCREAAALARHFGGACP